MAPTGSARPAAPRSSMPTWSVIPPAASAGSTRRRPERLPPSAGDRRLLGGLEAARHVGPVDDVPQGAEEVGLHVLVLQVKRVLPGVEDEERDRALADAALVVVDLLHNEAAGERLVRQHAPARALDRRGGLGELRLELVEGSEVLVDVRPEGAVR